jgi:hypothetical protein
VGLLILSSIAKEKQRPTLRKVGGTSSRLAHAYSRTPPESPQNSAQTTAAQSMYYPCPFLSYFRRQQAL